LLAHQDVDYVWGNVPPRIVLSWKRATQYKKEERWSRVFEEQAHKNTRLMVSSKLNTRKLRMAQGSNLKLWCERGRRAHRLNIQVLHVQRVLFDELPASFDVFAHQRGEDGFALGDVFKPH
jgi:hypothetical protein